MYSWTFAIGFAAVTLIAGGAQAASSRKAAQWQAWLQVEYYKTVAGPSGVVVATGCHHAWRSLEEAVMEREP